MQKALSEKELDVGTPFIKYLVLSPRSSTIRLHLASEMSWDEDCLLEICLNLQSLFFGVAIFRQIDHETYQRRLELNNFFGARVRCTASTPLV